MSGPKAVLERKRQEVLEERRRGCGRIAFLAVREEVGEALDQGLSVKDVWEALSESGFPVGYSQFSRYVREWRGEGRRDEKRSGGEDGSGEPDESLGASGKQGQGPARNGSTPKGKEAGGPVRPGSARRSFQHNPVPDKDELI